jgi:hypothetical protein
MEYSRQKIKVPYIYTMDKMIRNEVWNRVQKLTRSKLTYKLWLAHLPSRMCNKFHTQRFQILPISYETENIKNGLTKAREASRTDGIKILRHSTSRYQRLKSKQ